MINIFTGSASRGGDGPVRKLGDGNSPLNKIFDDQHIICRTIIIDDIGDDKMMRMMTVAKMSPGALRQTN